MNKPADPTAKPPPASQLKRLGNIALDWSQIFAAKAERMQRAVPRSRCISMRISLECRRVSYGCRRR